MGPDSMGAAWIWGQVGYQGHGADGAAYPGHPRRVRAHLSHLSAHLPISRLGLGQGIFDHGYTGVPALMLGYERTRRSLEVPGITPWPPTPRAPTALLTWPVWCAMGIWDTPPCRCCQLYDRARYPYRTVHSPRVPILDTSLFQKCKMVDFRNFTPKNM